VLYTQIRLCIRMLTESIAAHKPAADRSNLLVLLLGAAGAGLVGLAFAAPWIAGLIAAACILFLSFVENQTLLVTLVFIMPLDITLREGAPIRDIAVAVRLLVVIGYFLGRFLRAQLDLGELWRPAITKAACLFLLCLVISVLFSRTGETRVELRGVYFIGSYIAYYLAMMDWLQTADRRRKVLLALLVSTSVVGLFGLGQKLAEDYSGFWCFMYAQGGSGGASVFQQEHGRIPSLLSAHNHLAGYLDLILPFAIAGYLLSKQVWWKRLSALCVILGVIGLILTQSRGGYLAFIAIIICSIWQFGKTGRRKVLLLLVFAFLLTTAYGLLQLWSPGHFADYSSDMSILSRFYLWLTAWDFFLSSPLHGVGLGTLAILFEKYVVNIPGADPNVQLEAHNIYFELLAETGILGFVSFWAVVVAALREARRQLRSRDWMQQIIAFGVAAGTVGILVDGCFDHYFFWTPQVGFLFWLGIAGLTASAGMGCPTEKEMGSGR